MNPTPYLTRNDISDFDKRLIQYMQSIGFEYASTRYTSEKKMGETEEWKYYPSYMDDKHYTLVLYHHLGPISSDRRDPEELRSYLEHRLYIHYNDGGRYFDSLYQMSGGYEWSQKLIMKVNNIFVNEVRDITLNQILDETI